MAGELSILPVGGELIRHHPEVMREEQAKADAIIQYAAKVKDWPLLEQAVDTKIEQQQEFVEWWDDSIRANRRPLTNAGPGYLPVSDASSRTGITQQQVSRWRGRLADAVKYRTQQILAAYRKAGLEPEANHLAEGTGLDEWFTPPEYIDAAREVLGENDLDPATHPKAQEWIKATRFYTKADDALSQDWHGRIWLNPPYSRKLIGFFAAKLVAEIDTGRVMAAITLTHNYTDTEWFHRIADRANAICFTRGRIRFVDDCGEPCAPTQGQAFCYYGPHVGGFADVFKAFGLILFPE
jgi:phage N-6-adenine-methyltransferase